MGCAATNIRIEPVDVTWEIEEQWDIKARADVAGDLGAKWFKLAATGSTIATHYVWYDTGASVDPAPVGLTGIEVTISANDTAIEIAAATATAIDAVAAFKAEVDADDTEMFVVTNVGTGKSFGAADGTAATGFEFTLCQEGGYLNLGLLDGDVEVAFEETLFELTAHQTGVAKIADLRQGNSATISLTMKETAKSSLRDLFIATSGGTYTPASGTELFGWGTNRQGSSTIIQARRLILHPVRLPADDHSDDFCFMKSYPAVDTLTFSGENPSTLSATFNCYLDNQQTEALRLFSVGDWTQLIPE